MPPRHLPTLVLLLLAVACGAPEPPAEAPAPPPAASSPTPAPPPPAATPVLNHPLTLEPKEGDPLSIGLADLAFLEERTLRKRAGAAGKSAWSLRDVVEQQLGEGSRVVELVDHDGGRYVVSEATWSDPNRTPTIRVNSNGDWRFHWTDAEGVIDRSDGNGFKRVRTVLVVGPQGRR